MNKYLLRDLKALKNDKIATNITNLSFEEVKALRSQENGLEKIGYSSGVYGCNGILLKGQKSQKLYVITARTTAFFMF